jgi:hypothetical protein
MEVKVYNKLLNHLKISREHTTFRKKLEFFLLQYYYYIIGILFHR